MLNFKIQLRSNPIICWKFCYTFHKLLRDGHPNVNILFINNIRFQKKLIFFLGDY